MDSVYFPYIIMHIHLSQLFRKIQCYMIKIILKIHKYKILQKDKIGGRVEGNTIEQCEYCNKKIRGGGRGFALTVPKY